jgi:hypothetical protein
LKEDVATCAIACIQEVDGVFSKERFIISIRNMPWNNHVLHFMLCKESTNFVNSKSYISKSSRHAQQELYIFWWLCALNFFPLLHSLFLVFCCCCHSHTTSMTMLFSVFLFVLKIQCIDNLLRTYSSHINHHDMFGVLFSLTQKR